MAVRGAVLAALVLCLVSVSGVAALTKCAGSPGAAQTVPSVPKPLFYVDSGVTSDVVFVRGAPGSAWTVTPYGGSASFKAQAQEDGTTRATIAAVGGCVQVSVPAGAPYFGVFANGLGTRAFVADVDVGTLVLKADGQGILNSTANFTADACTFSTNGNAKLHLMSGSATCGVLTSAMSDGTSNLAYFGSIAGPSTIDLVNGQAYMYLGHPASTVNIKLIDGAAKLRIAGTPGMVVSGQQNGAANNIKILAGSCGAGLPRCTKVPSNADFWN